MKRLITFLLTVLCCIVQFHAQVAVSGIVTDNNSGHPVEFATVTLQQGDQWCMTDKQGAFTLHTRSSGKGLSENAFQ